MPLACGRQPGMARYGRTAPALSGSGVVVLLVVASGLDLPQVFGFFKMGMGHGHVACRFNLNLICFLANCVAYYAASQQSQRLVEWF